MSRSSKVINIIGGPGVGKSLTCAFLFGELKIINGSCEFVQEVAKDYVWAGDFAGLNNQYSISSQMYKKIKSVDGKVDYIITDGSLLHGLYYNRHNEDNVSNVEKTEELIIDKFREFDNVVFMIKRGSFEYEQEGRIQTLNDAIEVDNEIKNILSEYNIKYFEIESGSNVDYILQRI